MYPYIFKMLLKFAVLLGTIYDPGIHNIVSCQSSFVENVSSLNVNSNQ